MNKEQTELNSNVHLEPDLHAAIEVWYEARHRYQIEPTRQNRDGYNASTDELGQSIARWQAQQPELVEQFRLWFRSHWGD